MREGAGGGGGGGAGCFFIITGLQNLLSNKASV